MRPKGDLVPGDNILDSAASSSLDPNLSHWFRLEDCLGIEMAYNLRL